MLHAFYHNEKSFLKERKGEESGCRRLLAAFRAFNEILQDRGTLGPQTAFKSRKQRKHALTKRPSTPAPR